MASSTISVTFRLCLCFLLKGKFTPQFIDTKKQDGTWEQCNGIGSQSPSPECKAGLEGYSNKMLCMVVDALQYAILEIVYCLGLRQAWHCV